MDRERSLYYLDHEVPVHQAHTGSDWSVSKACSWHRRFGHLGFQGLQALANNRMVNGLDYDWKQETGFCEPCVKGKSHWLPFQQCSSNRASRLFELIHSDVCRKIGTASLGGGEYFVTFVHDLRIMCGSTY